MPIPFDIINTGPETIVFAHANGYPPRTYRRFLAGFDGRYRVVAPLARPLWPDSVPKEVRRWETLAADTLAFLDQRQLTNVIAVGHSLGAVTNMMAAAHQPARFRALVMIDPVFLPPALLLPMKLIPSLGRHNPMVKIAQNRRDRWPDRPAAFDHFRKKKVFARWSDDVMWDFVNEGLKDGEGEVVLAYPREWEARIYSLPPQVWRAVATVEKVGIPTLALRAEYSDALAVKAWHIWQKKQSSAAFQEIAGVGHMIPMEKPQLLASLIRTFFESLSAT